MKKKHQSPVLSLGLVYGSRRPVNPEFNGYSDGLFKSEVLGTCTVKTREYMNFNRAIRFAMRNQRKVCDLGGEQTRFYSAVYHHLGLKGVDSSELALYSGLDTPLGFYHHVDGFFAIQDVGVTVKCNMRQGSNAGNALVTVTPEDVLEDFWSVGEEIADYFHIAVSRGIKGLPRKEQMYV